MSIIEIIYLVARPVAIHHANKARLLKRNAFIYIYFVFYIVLAFVMVGPEAIIYYVAFLIFMITPLILSGISSFVKKQKAITSP